MHVRSCLCVVGLAFAGCGGADSVPPVPQGALPDQRPVLPMTLTGSTAHPAGRAVSGTLAIAGPCLILASGGQEALIIWERGAISTGEEISYKMPAAFLSLGVRAAAANLWPLPHGDLANSS